jgi:hypothetical protein
MDKTTYDYLKRTTKPIYWNREREKRTRKECGLNKKKNLFDTELKINLFRIGGFKNES